MSSVPSLVEGGAPSGSACSGWLSSVIGGFVEVEQLEEVGWEALPCCFGPFGRARPLDLALPLAPFPFLFLLNTKHRKTPMKCDRELMIFITSRIIIVRDVI